MLALDNVSLTLHPGSIHALVGENGAGKSTLIKILSGVVKSDAGAIHTANEPVSIHSPSDARRVGIAVVHQHTHLVPDLPVSENLALRQEYPVGPTGSIKWRGIRERGTAALKLLAPHINPNTNARSLSGVDRQLVELSFGLAAQPKLLILDEPTAVLPHHESETLFKRVREFAASGGAVLFVSHRLKEIFDLADTVTVLRDGKLVWTKPVCDTDADSLIRAMVGRSVSFERDPASVPAEGTAFEVDVAGTMLSLKRGEIYGLYGLVGAGQSELCHEAFGLSNADKPVNVCGAQAAGLSPDKRVDLGLGYVPADRLDQGVFSQFSVGENSTIAALRRYCRALLLRPKLERGAANEGIATLNIKTLGPAQNIMHLSGGNQQKVMLSRWLQTRPSVLILEEPTQGVDVGAKGEIHRIVRQLANEGVAVLVVSSEIPELLALSHRIGVMRDGKLVAQLDGATAREDEILRNALPDHAVSKPKLDVGGSAAKSSALGKALWWLVSRREAALTAFVVLFWAAASAMIPAFGTWANLRDILMNNSIVFVGALGMMLVIIAGGIDISAGLVMGLSAVVAGNCDLAGMPGWVCLLAALATGAALGFSNGFLSVAARVHPIVITLGTYSVLQSGILTLMDYKVMSLPGHMKWVAGNAAGVPGLIIIAGAAAVAVWYFCRSRVWGRRLYAFGGAPDSANYLGIYRRHALPLAFALSGVLLGLAAVMQSGKFNLIQTNVGQGYEMKFIAAAVIGGTSITGGRGSVLGTLAGTLFLGLVANVLVLQRVDPYWEQMVLGLMILAAVSTDIVTSRFHKKEEAQ